MLTIRSTFPIISIEAGNSRVKLGLFDSSPHPEEPWPECREFMALPVTDAVPWSTTNAWSNASNGLAVISGSNPSAIERLEKEWQQHTGREPLVVRSHLSIPVEMKVDYPERVGLDRLLKVVAVNVLRPASRAAIVVDSGTATTVDYVSSDGTFHGGSILPGLEMSAKALHHYTAVLPQIPVQELGGNPPTSPGRNTRDAIRNGLVWGQVGAIRELIRQLCLQCGHGMPEDAMTSQSPDNSEMNPEPCLFMTGGGDPVLAPHFPNATHFPSLGMHGLVLTAWHHAPKERSP